MIIKRLIDEDFVNYKKPSMLIAFPKCSFKCDKEYGSPICQNNSLVLSDDIKIDIDEIIQRYVKNDISNAIVIQGLEPFDSWNNLFNLIQSIRNNSIEDDIVIYTGYYENEIKNEVNKLKKIPNIIIKFGRYIPSQKPHYDEVLGIELASDNQYGVKIS